MSQEDVHELQAQLQQKTADLQRCEAQLEKSKAYNAQARDSLVRCSTSQPHRIAAIGFAKKRLANFNIEVLIIVPVIE